MQSELVVQRTFSNKNSKTLYYKIYSEDTNKLVGIYGLCKLYGDEESLLGAGRFARINPTLKKNLIIIDDWCEFEDNVTWIHERFSKKWNYGVSLMDDKSFPSMFKMNFYFEDPEEAVLFKFNQPS